MQAKRAMDLMHQGIHEGQWQIGDHLSKYAHFIPLGHPYSATSFLKNMADVVSSGFSAVDWIW
jgi:hypothetical protein